MLVTAKLQTAICSYWSVQFLLTDHISQYERGVRNPKDDKICAIAEILDVNPSFIKPIPLYFNNTPDKEFLAMTPEQQTYAITSKIPEKIKGMQESLMNFRDELLDLYAYNDEALLDFYNQLNHTGKVEAIKRTHELTQIEKYTIPDDVEDKR